MEGKILRAVNERDSLALTFKKDYPVFHHEIWHQSSGNGWIPSLIGRNYNYITIFYLTLWSIYLINRKHQNYWHLISILSSQKIGDFRILLSVPHNRKMPGQGLTLISKLDMIFIKYWLNHWGNISFRIIY